MKNCYKFKKSIGRYIFVAADGSKMVSATLHAGDRINYEKDNIFYLINEREHIIVGADDINEWIEDNLTQYYTEQEEKYLKDMRDKAIIASLQGALSNPEAIKDCVHQAHNEHKTTQDVVAESAILYADALIDKLRKEFQ